MIDIRYIKLHNELVNASKIGNEESVFNILKKINSGYKSTSVKGYFAKFWDPILSKLNPFYDKTEENAYQKSINDALYYAVRSGHSSLVKSLLNLGIDVKSRSSSALLLTAASNDNLEIIQLLLESGVDINIGKEYTFTALEATATRGNMELVRYLIEKRAEYTPCAMLYAALEGHIEIVRLFLSRGADANTCDKHGKPILELLRLKQNVPNREEIILLLKRAGAKG